MPAPGGGVADAGIVISRFGEDLRASWPWLLNDSFPDRMVKLKATTLESLKKRAAAFPEVIATSSRKGDGIPELRAAIARVAAERT